jgi:hypothetical protein
MGGPSAQKVNNYEESYFGKQRCFNRTGYNEWINDKFL